MTLLKLFFEFFKIGLFAIGGGLATLPFLYALADQYPEWLSRQMVVDMLAISESTPGPIGINMATYVGFRVAGVPGGILATLGLVTPSIIIIIYIAKFFKHSGRPRWVNSTLQILRPAVTGLIAAAGCEVIRCAVMNEKMMNSESTPHEPTINFFALFFLIFMMFGTSFWRKIPPVLWILLGAILGILFKI